jgi:hypothetical protein
MQVGDLVPAIAPIGDVRIVSCLSSSWGCMGIGQLTGTSLPAKHWEERAGGPNGVSGALFSDARRFGLFINGTNIHFRLLSKGMFAQCERLRSQMIVADRPR